MEHRPRTPAEGINVTPTHPLRELALLVGGIAGVVIVFTAAAVLFVDTLIVYLPPSLEVRIFSGLFSLDSVSSEDTRLGPTRDLFVRIASHWPEHPPLEIGVLDDDEPNALALPGGTILVTRGLLDRVESENELGFVLGHELGHFRHRDHLRGLGRGLVLGLVMSAVAGAGAADTLPMLLSALTQLRFARAQESQADQFGLLLLEGEFGHVAGADRFFQRLEERDPDRLGGLGSYLETHPSSAQRIAALQETAERQGYPRVGSLRPLPTPFAHGHEVQGEAR